MSLSAGLLLHAVSALPPAELDALVADVIASSRAAWPAVVLDDREFVTYLAPRLAADVPVETALRTLCIRDLWLACAIVRGDAIALGLLDGHALDHVGAAIAHLDGGSALIEDVAHAVRARVLGGAGSTGAIHEYRGRGDLRGWLRVIAVREALQLLRARRRETPITDDLAAKLEHGVEQPSLSADERRVYQQAFTAALATLTPRERNLLRQQYIYGATIDELGALYGVHRATAARWLAQIRETLLRRTRREIGDALRLTGDELDSAMGRVADHLDYSLRQTLSLER